MKIFLIILLIILALIMYLLFAPVCVHAKYLDKKLSLHFSFGPFKFTLNKEKKDKENKGKNKPVQKDKKEKLDIKQNLIKFSAAYTNAKKQIRRHIKIQKLEITVHYGHDDAAVTGVITGLFYSVFYQFFGAIASVFSYNAPKFEVIPDFDTPQFDISVDGIIKSRLAHIILIALKFIKEFK